MVLPPHRSGTLFWRRMWLWSQRISKAKASGENWLWWIRDEEKGTKPNINKPNIFQDSLMCFGQVSFHAQTVTHTVYVLIVLSVGPVLTLPKPHLGRFLRQALKAVETSLTKGYCISDQECGELHPALFRSPLIHFTICVCPFSWFLRNFVSMLTPVTLLEVCPFAYKVEGRAPEGFYLPVQPLANDWLAEETENSDPLPHFGINLEVRFMLQSSPERSGSNILWIFCENTLKSHPWLVVPPMISTIHLLYSLIKQMISEFASWEIVPSKETCISSNLN